MTREERREELKGNTVKGEKMEGGKSRKVVKTEKNKDKKLCNGKK